MERISAKVAGALGGLTLLLANASTVLAQFEDDYYYYDSYDSTGDPAAAAGVLGMSWLIVCCFGLVWLAMFAFNIWMLVHCIKNAPDDQKILWILLILFIPFGSVIYFFMKKKEWEGSSVPKSEPAAPAE